MKTKHGSIDRSMEVLQILTSINVKFLLNWRSFYWKTATIRKIHSKFHIIFNNIRNQSWSHGRRRVFDNCNHSTISLAKCNVRLASLGAVWVKLQIHVSTLPVDIVLQAKISAAGEFFENFRSLWHQYVKENHIN